MADQRDAPLHLSNSVTTGELRHIIEGQDRFYATQIDALETRMEDYQRFAERALDLAKISNDKATEALAAALTVYKASVNEWQLTFREVKADTFSRKEMAAALETLRVLIDKVNERVNELVNQRSRGAGADETTEAYRVQANWRIGIAIVVTGLVLGLVYFVIGRLG